LAIAVELDGSVRAEARRRGDHIRRMRTLLRWGGGAAAAVAAVLVVALRLMPDRLPVFHPQARVTILDAFSLARQLKAGAKIDKSWDVTGDGHVDQADVDALAARAVALPKGGTP
jgi:hypothetical protein